MLTTAVLFSSGVTVVFCWLIVMQLKVNSYTTSVIIVNLPTTKVLTHNMVMMASMKGWARTHLQSIRETRMVFSWIPLNPMRHIHGLMKPHRTKKKVENVLCWKRSTLRISDKFCKSVKT